MPDAPAIRFEDGAAYERYMGLWSRRVGAQFIDWLAPAPAMRWLDVGCGNGAFTELLVERCDPTAVDGVDPSPQQLAFARARSTSSRVTFTLGDAMALPYADRTFDAAVMPLVIFFVPEPARGVAEMRRVTRAGGRVCAYSWDLMDGGFPYTALHDAMRDLGLTVPDPPSPEASRPDVTRDLWLGAGLERVEMTRIEVARTFEDFHDYWDTVRCAPSVGKSLVAMSAELREALQQRVQARLNVDARGQITCMARANAIRGVVPG